MRGSEKRGKRKDQLFFLVLCVHVLSARESRKEVASAAVYNQHEEKQYNSCVYESIDAMQLSLLKQDNCLARSCTHTHTLN